MGTPLVPRQGAALSVFALAFVVQRSGARGRTGFSGSALRAGTGPQRRVAEDATRLEPREETCSHTHSFNEFVQKRSSPGDSKMYVGESGRGQTANEKTRFGV